jgi:hypothetical protein
MLAREYQAALQKKLEDVKATREAVEKEGRVAAAALAYGATSIY